MRIVPQKGVLVGARFDVFGYWKEIYTTLSDDENGMQREKLIKKALSVSSEKESTEVYQRTVAS